MAKPKLKLGQYFIYYLSLIAFFAIFSTTISKSPVLSLYAKSMGATESIIGLIAFFSPLAGILFSFPIGMLSDRFGRKRLLLISGAVMIVAPLMYFFVINPFYLIPIRFFHGIATAILGPVISAMIVERYAKNKGEMLGIYSSATLVGRAIAPLVGGAIISVFLSFPSGFNYRIVYIAALISGMLAFIFILFTKDAKNRIDKPGLSEFLSSLKYFVGEKRLFATSLVEMATYFSYGIFETYIPLFLAAKNVPAYEIGLIFSAQILAIALSKPFFGKLADRIDMRMQILAGILTIGITMAIITLFSNMIAILVIGIIFGIGLSFSTVATSAYVGEITKKDKLGASMGALSSIMDIGHSTGPFIAGVIIQATTYSAGFMAALVLSVGVAVFFYISNFTYQIEERKN